MRTVVRRVGYGFLGGGLLYGLVAAGLALEARQFGRESVSAVAKVVSFQERQSSDFRVLYAPVLEFETASGLIATFTSHSASLTPAYRVGDTVQVAYRKPNGADAREASSNRILGLLFGVLGVLCATLGGAIVIHPHLEARRAAALQRSGVVVRAAFKNVETNHGLEVNGQHPWRIVAQWRHPASGALHLFTSDNIWFDPTAHITTSEIAVHMDPNNPRRFYMDLSFLPAVAS